MRIPENAKRVGHFIVFPPTNDEIRIHDLTEKHNELKSEYKELKALVEKLLNDKRE